MSTLNVEIEEKAPQNEGLGFKKQGRLLAQGDVVVGDAADTVVAVDNTGRKIHEEGSAGIVVASRCALPIRITAGRICHPIIIVTASSDLIAQIRPINSPCTITSVTVSIILISARDTQLGKRDQ